MPLYQLPLHRFIVRRTPASPKVNSCVTYFLDLVWEEMENNDLDRSLHCLRVTALGEIVLSVRDDAGEDAQDLEPQGSVVVQFGAPGILLLQLAAG